MGRRKPPDAVVEPPPPLADVPQSDTNGNVPDQVPAAAVNGTGEKRTPARMFSYLVARDTYVQASVWDRHVTLTDGMTFTAYEVSLRKRYKDAKDGEWKSASAFRGSELYAVLHAIQQANAWILEARAESNDCTSPAREE